MNKTELIDKIAEKSQLTKADAKKALDATVEALKEALVAGDKVQLVGFGTFSVNERPAREGINPATKQKIQIAAKKVAKFKAGAELADAVNK
ncbi:MAG: HU family DNA-binding protein [Prevotella sp.]|uniref:HU family DNA-binding protein n=1 Tax=Prevotella sp. AGR2160 TaxID=1280674 RepID=UPI000421DB0D|nr:HU family DNA-binding protein [Prevotella sp. AGR2160]MDD5862519.1 HU family DNA-binding protein [Prevotella sp.]